MNWTESAVAELRQMVAAKMTAAKIGAHFGITRNAVIGKAHRMKLRLLGGNCFIKSAPAGRGAGAGATRRAPGAEIEEGHDMSALFASLVAKLLPWLVAAGAALVAVFGVWQKAKAAQRAADAAKRLEAATEARRIEEAVAGNDADANRRELSKWRAR